MYSGLWKSYNGPFTLLGGMNSELYDGNIYTKNATQRKQPSVLMVIEVFNLICSTANAENPAPKSQKHAPENRGSGAEKNQNMMEMNGGTKTVRKVKSIRWELCTIRIMVVK
jgi:hypothetical protein